MKLKFLLASCAFLMVCFSSTAQYKEIYLDPAFTTLAKSHKVLAILPFQVSIGLRPGQAQRMSAERMAQIQKNEGRAIQSALQTYFLKERKKDGLTVTFQDINASNALLLQNNISPEDIQAYTPAQLAKILGVDGVVMGLFSTDKPVSEGAYVALNAVTGIYTNTNSGKTAISIYDGATGTLLWKYEKSLGRGLGSTTSEIIDAIMRKASKQFPYAKLKS